MHRSLRHLLPAMTALLLLASCQSVPKHARFVPKDALMVLGLHTGEMRKELAWSAVTGSSLLDELRKSAGSKAPDMLKDIENAGIDFGSTLYLYSQPDTRFERNARMGLVLPVADEAKLAAYIKKHAPGAVIRKVGKRSEAMIEGKAYVGWNDEVLIAMNPVVQQITHEEGLPDSAAGMPGQLHTWVEQLTDSAATIALMDSAFNPGKNSGISENKRFKELQNGGHDISLWVAYDAMMDAYGSSGGMMGRAMGNTLMKGSAMATGFDFEKGRLDGAMRYYPSDSMQSVMKEFGKEQVDADMLRRLPSGGLNFAAGYHLAPRAVRMMLDKLGFTGLANLALMQKGLNVDDILGSFSGDMVLSLNNFRVETKLQEIDSATQREFGLTPLPISSPEVDYVYALKIGDKAKMDKLLAFFTSSDMLQQTAPNVYRLPVPGTGPSLLRGEKYVAIASTAAAAQAFLDAQAGTMPAAVKEQIAGHPVGMWADVRSFVSGAGTMSQGGSRDSAAMIAVRNLLTTFTFKGGEFKENASEYRMSLSFTNKDESSLVQLLHLAQQLAALKSKEEVARR